MFNITLRKVTEIFITLFLGYRLWILVGSLHLLIVLNYYSICIGGRETCGKVICIYYSCNLSVRKSVKMRLLLDLCSDTLVEKFSYSYRGVKNLKRR